MTDLQRRRLLAVTSTALVGAVAGCSSSDDGNGDDPEETETDGETDLEGTILGDVTIDNLDTTSHTVDVIVEFDGEIEEWVTESLDGGSGVTLARDWSTDPGTFRVTARLDGDEVIEFDSDPDDGPDCLNLFVRIARDGGFSFLSNTDGGPCGSGDADIDDAETA